MNDKKQKKLKEIEDKEKCPKCKGNIIQHIENIFLCEKCGNILVYNIRKEKFEK